MKSEKIIDAYQHVRNPNCIYRRVGDTNVFVWENYKRTEAGILYEIHINEKFKIYVEPGKC